jgi:hypothetical protein
MIVPVGAKEASGEQQRQRLGAVAGQRDGARPRELARSRAAGDRVLVGAYILITCLLCEARVLVWRGDLWVECQCGVLYNALTRQPVKEPICQLSPIGA